jgi:hypothetical protein
LSNKGSFDEFNSFPKRKDTLMMNPEPRTGIGGFLKSRNGLVLLGFLAIATYFLATEHTAHFFGALPFVLLLCCPLMMLFMHGGHGGHGGQPDEHAGHSDGQSTGGTVR